MRAEAAVPRMTPAEITPVAGARFRKAAGFKAQLSPVDLRIICLVAAYADAGERSPSMKQLSARLGLPRYEINGTLYDLARRRIVWVERPGVGGRPHGARNRFTCRFAGDPLPDDAKRVIYRNNNDNPRRPHNAP